MRDRKHLFLVGFPGSGKSTVGPLLARQRKAGFVDLDEIITSKEGVNIPDIFRIRGERQFRRVETRALRAVVTGARRPSVIALGGGALESAENRKLVFASGIVVYLSCSVRELYRRLKHNWDRPMLQVKPRSGETLRQARIRRVESLLKRRLPRYGQANITCSTSHRTVSQSVRDIEKKVRKLNDRD